jgi:ureidoacrylate peracid hydrolase
MPKSPSTWDPFAVLLIDVQQDFWSKRRAEQFPDFPAHITRLLQWCRGSGPELIHLHASFQPDQSDWMVRYHLSGEIPCVQGTPGIRTLPFGLEAPGEAVIIKHSFDGFQNPDLLTYLRVKGKRFLLTAGLITSTCVFLTTASAAQNGFLAAIIEDCCADDPAAHEYTLNRYPYIFDRVRLDQTAERQPLWLDQLSKIQSYTKGSTAP